ncbi:(Na+)-NQR maturation NqrM [Neisseriaceae bacterium PsAf]|nr:(Na+)-NQR maturation NqrM [Neisseriaceae bacterium PsAf]
MKELLLAFIIFLVFILFMSLGYILKRKSIQGSCGGITALGMEKVCQCKEPCAKKKAQLQAQKIKENI